MSRAHLYLKRAMEDSEKAVYVAMSSDFSSTSTVEPIAEISIDKIARRYEFSPLGPWRNEKVLPPLFFATPAEEQADRYNREFAGFKYGAWTARIHSWVTNLIETGLYPENAPTVE